MGKVLLIVCFFFIPFLGNAQELDCSVEVIAPEIQGTRNQEILRSMKKDIREFMNTQTWTDADVQVQERISCSILLHIREKTSNDRFKGSIQVESSRIVYNSAYSSPVLSHKDENLNIRYIENMQMEFSKDRHRSNLTSILAYYAYMILGMDFDTFSPEGGTKYYQTAQQIVNNAQGASEKGWKSHESKRNRYWLVNNILDQRFEPMRKALYQYHRKGLDKMYEDRKEGRKAIIQSLKKLEKVHEAKPNSFNMKVFFRGKNEELVKIFSEAPTDEKNKVYDLLRKLDPANISDYKKIVQG